MRRPSGPSSGAARHGTSATYRALPELLDRLALEHPEVRATTLLMAGTEIAAAVHAGETDIGILRTIEVTDSLMAVPCGQDRLGVAMRADHPLAAHPSLRGEQLRFDDIVLHPRERHPGHHDALLAHLRRWGADQRLVVPRAAFDPALRRLLDGSITVVGGAVQATLSPELTWRPIDDPDAVMRWAVVTRRRNVPPIAKAVVEMLRRHAGDRSP